MMLYRLAFLVVLVMVGTGGASAQTATPTILANGVQRFYPGADNGECFDLAAGSLKTEAASPPGRTGESAYLDVGTEADPSALMRALVSDAGVVSQHEIRAGRYCYTISVTQRLPDTGDPNRPDRPTKQVWLRLAYLP